MSEGENDNIEMCTEQERYLIKFMKEDEFASFEENNRTQKKWEILAEQLNALGPKKSVVNWKRAWFDLETKMNDPNYESPPSSPEYDSPPSPITDFHDRVMNLMSKVSVYGLEPEENIILESS